MRPRSPIEQMVDAACGFVPIEPLEGPPTPPEDGVLLVCGRCGAKQWDERIAEYFDFDIIATTCPGCRPKRSGRRARARG